MSNPPIPTNEKERLDKLQYYDILDTSPEAAFDDLTQLVANILNVPIVLVSLIDKDRQWFKSKVGLDANETSREISFCQYAIMGEELFEVTNALEDERFRDNPLVTGDPNIRFYGGAPLTDDQGLKMGTLCAIDRKPKKLTKKEKEGLVAISKTIMRLIQFRRQKKEAEKLAIVKDEFLSNMSHEIRTPLNAIIGFTDLLGQSSLTKHQLKLVDTVTIASQNLLVLINDILDVSKLERGKVQIERKSFNLLNTINHVISLQYSKAREKGLKLISSIDYEIPEYVLGDKTRLIQILINLITNALKFTDEGYVELKVIEVANNGEKSSLRFTVKDTGIGIENEKLNTIFKRFEQVETSTTRNHGGAGLGLSIVNMLVELHAGKLSVESKVNVGSEFTFEIEFPLEVSPIDDPRISRSSNEKISSLKGVRVLLAEDNEHNQILATTYLQNNNAQVDLAENGEVVIDLLKQNKYDLILMDLQMPKMDGFMATKVIREELHMDIPIVACSAHSLVGERERCIQNNMDEYISKPYTESRLINTVHQFVLKSRTSKAAKNAKDIIKTDDFNLILEQLKEKEHPDLVAALIKVFKKRIPEDIKDLERGLANQDLQIIKAKSHLLAGSFASLGFNNGYELAQKTVESAVKEHLPEALEYTYQLIEYLNQAMESIK